ncbi:prenyl cysteine carboxyl methyltransferase Ste14 [Talaromyces proteolyticus]|uniref:Protein-S-isoprenylcysteine O-methyltransferase n=1 Tax=Talaromyces proteolyticus TaxID=1131652 RepID=A0AAD4PX45_9EURO|nr:prenyl cysteine carboxyl methyltransferase Ste14 [Talaromyces proteolyticus]KAH8696004.1 prenyl cysteine carboxyl methyltransferase Ste14 [Talaromyces proteolyticus]
MPTTAVASSDLFPDPDHLDPTHSRHDARETYTAWRPPTTTNIHYSDDNTSSGTTSTAETRIIDPSSLLPGGKMSLSGISNRAFILGVVLGVTSVITILLALQPTPTPLWRVPFFISSLCFFHYLEFWVTAEYNTRYADVSSFLLSANGAAYNIAHGSAIVECLVSHWLAPNGYIFNPDSVISVSVTIVGLVLMIIGQIVRTSAMATAGSNFNHVVQVEHRQGHVLVTSGIYRLLRHPSYFGFFWWGLGTQMVLKNVICFIGYALVLWRFFYSRIQREERFLVSFFGDNYVAYKRRTLVGIPFVA